MSILIPGISMPKDASFPLSICITKDGTVTDAYGCPLMDDKAIELPPHGRLGDLDALEKFLRAEHEASSPLKPKLNKDFVRGVEKTLEWVCYCLKETAHTIIPADPERGGIGNV